MTSRLLTRREVEQLRQLDEVIFRENEKYHKDRAAWMHKIENAPEGTTDDERIALVNAMPPTPIFFQSSMFAIPVVIRESGTWQDETTYTYNRVEQYELRDDSKDMFPDQYAWMREQGVEL